MHRCTQKVGIAVLEKIGMVVFVVAGLMLLLGYAKKELWPAVYIDKKIDKVSGPTGQALEKTGENIPKVNKSPEHS